MGQPGKSDEITSPVLGPYKRQNHINFVVIRGINVDWSCQTDERECGSRASWCHRMRHGVPLAQGGGTQCFSAGESGFYMSTIHASPRQERLLPCWL